MGSTIQRRPPRPSVPGGAELLAEDRVARARLGQAGADHLLDRAVGLGDRREVGLGLHHQVGGAEPAHRERVGGVGERVREVEIGGEVGVGADAGNVARTRAGPPRPRAAVAARLARMARRWILTVIVAAVLVVAGVFAARAIRDDDSNTDAAPGATTTTSSVTTTAPASSTTTRRADDDRRPLHVGAHEHDRTAGTVRHRHRTHPCRDRRGGDRRGAERRRRVVPPGRVRSDVGGGEPGGEAGREVRRAHGDPPRRRRSVDDRRPGRHQRRVRSGPPTGDRRPRPVLRRHRRPARNDSTAGGRLGRRAGRGRIEPHADGSSTTRSRAPASNGS